MDRATTILVVSGGAACAALVWVMLRKRTTTPPAQPPPGQNPQPPSIEQVWAAHRHEMGDVPTSEQRQHSLRIWHEAIDKDAHDYSDWVAAHPQMQRIAQLHAEAVVLAFIAGYMAGRGW